LIYYLVHFIVVLRYGVTLLIKSCKFADDLAIFEKGLGQHISGELKYFLNLFSIYLFFLLLYIFNFLYFNINVVFQIIQAWYNKFCLFGDDGVAYINFIWLLFMISFNSFFERAVVALKVAIFKQKTGYFICGMIWANVWTIGFNF